MDPFQYAVFPRLLKNLILPRFTAADEAQSAGCPIGWTALVIVLQVRILR
jgi:hypothetical protein